MTDTANSFWSGALAAFIGAIVGAVLPWLLSSRSSTVSAIDLLCSELETNLAMLRDYAKTLRDRPRTAWEWLPPATDAHRLELRSVALAACVTGMAGLRDQTRGAVMLAYQHMERIERAVDRLDQLKVARIQASRAPDRSTGRYASSLPNYAGVSAIAKADAEVSADCVAASDCIDAALVLLRSERAEFREGRLW